MLRKKILSKYSTDDFLRQVLIDLTKQETPEREVSSI